MAGFKILGTTDDVTECGVCGRVELRATVAIVALDADGNEDGEPVYAGTSCAARKVGVKSTDIRAAVKAYNLHFEVARCNFPDYFRSIMRMSVEEYLHKYPEHRAVAEGTYRRYMQREGFAV